VQLLTEKGWQRVDVKACGRVPISAKEKQEIVIKIDEPTCLQGLPRVRRRGWEQVVWLADIETTAMDQPGRS
jgi:hypothetical protein